MIDEKKLINYIKTEINPYGRPFEGTVFEFGRKVMEHIEKMDKVGEWIPVEDRLPEDGEDVLVWFEYFRYGSYNRLFQTHGLSYAYDGKWSGFVNGQSGWHQLSIIAWMPLPAPYDMRKKVEE